MTTLIVVLKGKDEVNDGAIIKFGQGASVETVRELAADSLGLKLPLSVIELEDETGSTINELDVVYKQKVIYINIKEGVKEIPGPTPRVFVGNLFDLAPDFSASWRRLHAEYGPLIKVNLIGREFVDTSDPDIAEFFSKESDYFTKKIIGGMEEIKPIGGNGLFTSNTSDEDWKLAHKLLMPAFSARAIKVYQVEMGNIAQETIRVLEHFEKTGEEFSINLWTTNLTFETIGRIGFGYDFGLLDGPDAPVHPFITAMNYSLRTTFLRSQQAQFWKKIPTEQNRRFNSEIKLMQNIVDEVIAKRKESPDAKNAEKDLLGFMLNSVSENGLSLREDLIRDQVITFLIAGHETTSNTLTWAIYLISSNPEVEQKLLQEVVNVGITHEQLPTSEQVSRLKYVEQCLKETLRIYSPLRNVSKYCVKDCVVKGGYNIKSGTVVHVNVDAIHHNPDVWPDPEHFNPDRWLPEEEQKRSAYSWLPFSSGARGCIGRQFAMQEAKTVLAMFLHRYSFKTVGDQPIQYDPKSPTVRALNYYVTIHPRTNLPSPSSELSTPTSGLSTSHAETPKTSTPILTAPTTVANIPLPPITFLYGTQTGGSQDYASQLGAQAKSFGFKNVTVTDIDKWAVLKDGYTGPKGRDEQRHIVVVISATYNGNPPENAEKFDQWISNTSKDSENVLEGLLFTVFGCGNKQWRTYQAFPTKIDDRLDCLGAERLFPRGEGNADADIDADFQEWSTRFWSSTLQFFGVQTNSQSASDVLTPSNNDPTSGVIIEFISPRNSEYSLAKENQNGTRKGVLRVNKELQKNSDRSTRHLEIEVEEGMEYRAGDHLEVMPQNDEHLVEKIAIGFGLVLDSVFEVKEVNNEYLSPRSLAATIKGPCSIHNALKYYADLTSAPSRYLLASIANKLEKIAPELKAEVLELLEPGKEGQAKYTAFVKKNRTLVDLQEAYPQVKELDWKEFLCSVSVMQPRRYSISSSSLEHSNSVHLTVGVVKDTGANGHIYSGLSSGFLASTHQNDTINVSVKKVKGDFYLPEDDTAPIIMICAGTGLAPFRGFLQERHARGLKSPAHLFFGARHSDHDFLYEDELKAYVADGTLTELHATFSRSGDVRKYVQHQILSRASLLWDLMIEQNGIVYICGSASGMAKDVRRTFELLAMQMAGINEEKAKEYMSNIINEKRYNEDVWG